MAKTGEAIACVALDLPKRRGRPDGLPLTSEAAR